MRPHQMHTIKHLDHIAIIREAAIRRVDLDTDVFRPEVLSKLNLKASSSPRKTQLQQHGAVHKSSLPTTQLPSQPRRIKTPRSRKKSGLNRDASRRLAERARVQHGHYLVQEAKQEEMLQHERKNATPGEKNLATSIRKAHEILLAGYKDSIKKTRALESEQKEWRHQSPSKRTVNTSPTRSWSTKRGKNISQLAATAESRNPPAFKSASLLRLSPHTSRSSTKNYGAIIASTPTKRDRVVRSIGF